VPLWVDLLADLSAETSPLIDVELARRHTANQSAAALTGCGDDRSGD
jgi:hypothetical protein